MFLNDSAPNQANAALYGRDIADDGYVSNFTRLWGWRSDLFEAFFNLPKRLMDETTLTVRERAILACAIAANLGDSYCALGWGARLASESSPTIAAAVLQRMKHSQLSARENALATWAHKVVGDPNAITAGDVDRLGATGVTEQEIFDATLFVAFRL